MTKNLRKGRENWVERIGRLQASKKNEFKKGDLGRTSEIEISGSPKVREGGEC